MLYQSFNWIKHPIRCFHVHLFQCLIHLIGCLKMPIYLIIIAYWLPCWLPYCFTQKRKTCKNRFCSESGPHGSSGYLSTWAKTAIAARIQCPIQDCIYKLKNQNVVCLLPIACCLLFFLLPIASYNPMIWHLRYALVAILHCLAALRCLRAQSRLRIAYVGQLGTRQ